MRLVARRITNAMRDGARRETERAGPGRCRATVVSVAPLRLDPHGVDIDDLDETDVTLGRSVIAEGFQAGDVLVLVEVEPGEWTAVDVEDTGG